MDGIVFFVESVLRPVFTISVIIHGFSPESDPGLLKSQCVMPRRGIFVAFPYDGRFAPKGRPFTQPKATPWEFQVYRFGMAAQRAKHSLVFLNDWPVGPSLNLWCLSSLGDAQGWGNRRAFGPPNTQKVRMKLIPNIVPFLVKRPVLARLTSAFAQANKNPLKTRLTKSDDLLL
jgi:hypothetical protein